MTDFYRRIDSGETVSARAAKSGRPGVTITVSTDRRRTIELAVGGIECDWQRIDHCPRETNFGSGLFPSDIDAIAGLELDLRDAMTAGALPLPYGSGLPVGHDAYPVWETTSHYLKFRVYATVDLRLAP